MRVAKCFTVNLKQLSMSELLCRLSDSLKVTQQKNEALLLVLEDSMDDGYDPSDLVSRYAKDNQASTHYSNSCITNSMISNKMLEECSKCIIHQYMIPGSKV